MELAIVWPQLSIEFLGALGSLLEGQEESKEDFRGWRIEKNMDRQSASRLSAFLGFIKFLSQFLTPEFLLCWKNLSNHFMLISAQDFRSYPVTKLLPYSKYARSLPLLLMASGAFPNTYCSPAAWVSPKNFLTLSLHTAHCLSAWLMRNHIGPQPKSSITTLGTSRWTHYIHAAAGTLSQAPVAQWQPTLTAPPATLVCSST